MKQRPHPRRSASSTRPPGPETGYSHPRCYANALTDCSPDITREHYISESILRQIGETIQTSGYTWLGGTTKSLTPKALRAKILCARHNSALSPLDGVAGDLFEALREIDTVLGDDAPPAPSKDWLLNGGDLQRWMLKALLGAMHSGGIVPAAARGGSRLVEIIFGQATWPTWWGLYFAPKEDGEYSFQGVGMQTWVRDEEIWGLVANVAGLRLLLALGRPDLDKVGYHPAGVKFNHADRPGEQTVTLAWPSKPYAQYLPFTRSRPYGGEPINHF